MAVAAILLLITLALLSVFQAVLASGAPYGHFAWGGQHKVLPASLRAGSIISIVIYACIGCCIVSKVGIYQIIPKSTFLDIILWAITVYFFIGILMNSISRSKYERNIMVPVSSVLAVCSLMITLS